MSSPLGCYNRRSGPRLNANLLERVRITGKILTASVGKRHPYLLTASDFDIKAGRFKYGIEGRHEIFKEAEISEERYEGDLTNGLEC